MYWIALNHGQFYTRTFDNIKSAKEVYKAIELGDKLYIKELFLGLPDGTVIDRPLIDVFISDELKKEFERESLKGMIQ